jgi:hypothetical protein
MLSWSSLGQEEDWKNGGRSQATCWAKKKIARTAATTTGAINFIVHELAVVLPNTGQRGQGLEINFFTFDAGRHVSSYGFTNNGNSASYAEFSHWKKNSGKPPTRKQEDPRRLRKGVLVAPRHSRRSRMTSTATV